MHPGLANYLKDLQAPVYTRAEATELHRVSKEHETEAGRLAARNQLVLSQLPWAIRVATEFVGRMEIEDLVAEANVATIEAVEKFDPKRGALTTIVTMKVRQRLVKLCFERRTVIRVPGYLRFPGHAKHLLAKAEQAHAMTSQDFGSVAGSSVEYDQETREIELAQLRTAMAKLSERERQVIELRMQGKMLREVGDELGVTRQAVQQIERRGLHKLKKEFAALYPSNE